MHLILFYIFCNRVLSLEWLYVILSLRDISHIMHPFLILLLHILLSIQISIEWVHGQMLTRLRRLVGRYLDTSSTFSIKWWNLFVWLFKNAYNLLLFDNYYYLWFVNNGEMTIYFITLFNIFQVIKNRC
jgi:amino acid permease